MVALGRPWSIEELVQLSQGTFRGRPTCHPVEALSWDTRRLRADRPTVFIALRALRDGHDYIEKAFQQGATLCFTEQPLPLFYPHIQVKNTWEVLHTWAQTWRSELTFPLVGITGSVGKTWVKEWLAYLLEGWLSAVVRSPGSFNSQLGVPVSLLSFPPTAQLGLVEVGISVPGDMLPLARLLQPTYGILTRMGSAHDEAFPSFADKLKEKLKLFEGVTWLVALEQTENQPLLNTLSGTVFQVGLSASSAFRWEPIGKGRGRWHLPDAGAVEIHLPSESTVTWQNALLAASAAYLLGCPLSHLQEKLATLPPLPQRLQWIHDASGRLWINDTYHADYASLLAAIEEVESLPIEPKALILTDFSPYTRETHETVVKRLAQRFSPQQVHLIGPIFSAIGWGTCYPDKETFLRHSSVEGRAFLLKGSRRFHLEEVLSVLTGQGPAPELHIDQEKIYRNLRKLRSCLPPETRLLVMLKAAAYGGGDVAMATFLQRQGVDALGVAYLQEALRLREIGITLPILVFYPGQGLASLFHQHRLEVAVGTWESLTYWASTPLPLHIEFDTGMGRMGFSPAEAPAIIQFLQAHSAQVDGVFSHLAAGDDPLHPLTQRQLRSFEALYRQFQAAFPTVKGHLLNTAGILHIGASAAYDMVRLGIGLYGTASELEEATALYAPILRVASYPADTLLNYGFASHLPREGKVATVAIGYGDGLPRYWAEKGGYMYKDGEKLSILPPLNMDLTLVWAGDQPVQVGEQVEIWGPTRSLSQLAQEIGTSPYELLVRLSHRVRRLYTWGSL